ncbi:MAG: hypothetical protein H6536_00050 [Bacteroidales bacterium]|nr:hypothetical protein [Bacteroidales bacterium]
MKKQILFLAMLTMAIIFAGTNSVFGQLLPGVTTTTPIATIACETSALPLHPVPGVPFTYTMTNGSGATSANWTWYATKDANFVTAGTPPVLNLATQLTVASGDLVATGMSANYGVDNIGGTNAAENSVTINWSAAILAGTDYQGIPGPGTPTFVVGYSEGIAGCADNLQVFELNPQPNFTIDIAAIDATGTTLGWDVNTEEQCVDKVQSATYAAGAITVDYGTNTIYYEVAARNFVNDFAPSFTILGGLLTDQTATISIYASYSDATASTGALWTSAALTTADMNTLVNSNTSLDAVNVADIADGVSFFVKVVIDNNTEESLVDNPFVLAVDAYDNTSSGAIQAGVSIWDMEDADCPTLADAADQIDNATITITPRPTMEMDGAAMGEPSTVNPEDVINKLP